MERYRCFHTDLEKKKDLVLFIFFFSEWGKLFKMNILNHKLSSHYKLKIIDSWAKHATHPFFPLLSPLGPVLAHSYTSQMINLLSCDSNFPTPVFCFAMVSQISFSNNSVCCRHRGKKSSTWAFVWFRIWMSSGSGYQKGIRITGGCCPMEWWSHGFQLLTDHDHFCSLCIMPLCEMLTQSTPVREAMKTRDM